MAYPILMAAAIVPLWIITLIQGQRLYRAFLNKYPREASELIPFAFTRMRHPEKLFFFFRRSSMPLLKRDAHLWRMWRGFVISLALLFAIPVCFLVFGAIRTFSMHR